MVGITDPLLIFASRHEMAVEAYYGFPIPEKVFRSTITYREHVVIEVQELFSETWNHVHEHLYGRTVESGQETTGNHIFMKNHLYGGTINPPWDLAFS